MIETLDSRQLLAFCKLVQTGSYTETARILNLTQSAISHSVKNLESDLGCQLVTRSGRKLIITNDGELLYKDATSILNQMDVARLRIQDRTNWGRRLLRIGASTTACQHLLPNVLREFKECFPDCVLQIIPRDTPNLLDMIRLHELDLAIITYPNDVKSVELKPLFTDELIPVCSPIHTFTQTGSLKIGEERMVLYNKGSYTFILIEEFFRKNKLILNNFIHLGSMEAIKELVKINYGISFLASWIVENEINDGSLVHIQIPKSKLIRRWGVCFAKEKKLSITEETFLGICESASINLGNR